MNNGTELMHPSALRPQTTFLYFEDLAEPAKFLEEALELKLVEDHGFAKIYRMSGESFLGIVDEAGGHHKAQDKNAVLVTMVVDDVKPWHERLQCTGIRMLSGIKTVPEANLECFFFVGPGGYHFEIQKVLDPEDVAGFKSQGGGGLI